MKKIKIFLASSNELKTDRGLFEKEINRKNKAWIDQGIFLHLENWEDLSAQMSKTSSQDEYNQKIKACDLFVLLAQNKVGMYTAEEFDTAFGEFKTTQKPFIFTYFKQNLTYTKNQKKAQTDASLEQFKQKLGALGHFYSPYQNFEDLWNQFNKELERLNLAEFKENLFTIKPNGMNTNNQGDKNIVIETGNDINIQDNSTNYKTEHHNHHHNDNNIPHNLTKPPFVPGLFLGRENDIRSVHQTLFDESHLLLLVNGEGGIGKTTLAAHYYHHYQSHYHHIAWVYAEESLLDALLTLAPALKINFPGKMDGDKRLEQLLAQMAELEKPCLLVIDNANNLSDLESYYQALRSCPNFHILLTSRITEFHKIISHKINSLDAANAIKLFIEYYPKYQDAEQALLDSILVAVGYNTLVIELLAKSLFQANRLQTHYTLNDLLDDLQKKGLLALKPQRINTHYHANGLALRKETPESIIAAMYDLDKLNDAETSLLSIFSVLPAENIDYNILKTLLPEFDRDDSLLSLSQKGWLDNQQDSAFKISPVVQEITRQKNPVQLLDNCQELIENIIEKLLYEPGTGHFINASYSEALLWTHYGESLFYHLNQADDSLAILCERLGNYHRTTGNLIKALEFFEKNSKLSKKLCQDDPNNISFKNGLAISYSKLGQTHSDLGNLQQALKFFEDDIKISKELYQDYPNNVSFKNGLAISYIKLGLHYQESNKVSKAKDYFLLSKDLLAALVDDSPGYLEFQTNLDWVNKQLSEL